MGGKNILDRFADFIEKQVRMLWLKTIIRECQKFDRMKQKLLKQQARVIELLDKFEKIYGVRLGEKREE